VIPTDPPPTNAAHCRRAETHGISGGDENLEPTNHAEAIAIFRSEVIGALLRRGELSDALRKLSLQRFRLPGADVTRTIGVSTLERWYSAYKAGGLAALKPTRRSDAGRGRHLSDPQRKLLLDIRREHPSASATLIHRTLVREGQLDPAKVSVVTVRRLYVERGLDRRSLRAGAGEAPRLRWQAARPNALWHGDVCHGPAIEIDGRRKPLRIHALLDDCSRFVLAIEARHTEREVDMLHFFVRALRQHGAPDALYLDNGSTYRGETLRVACARLAVSLIHAQPYAPESRGKMERFWRPLREGCLDFMAPGATLHDVNVRLYTFLDEHYLRAPHAGLLGGLPGKVWRADPGGRAVDEDALRQALTVRVRRCVRKDSTLDVEGTTYQLDQGFLASRLVTVAYAVVDRPLAPWVEADDKTYPLREVDAVANGATSRKTAPPATPSKTEFDPQRPCSTPPSDVSTIRRTNRMPAAYLRHFNLASAPFTKEIDDEQLWMPSSKSSLVDRLCDAVRARESILLTGDRASARRASSAR
jgi:putative transposase